MLMSPEGSPTSNSSVGLYNDNVCTKLGMSVTETLLTLTSGKLSYSSKMARLPISMSSDEFLLPRPCTSDDSKNATKKLYFL